MSFHGRCAGFETDSWDEWTKHFQEHHQGTIPKDADEEAHWLGVNVLTPEKRPGQVWSLSRMPGWVDVAVKNGDGRNKIETWNTTDLKIQR